METTLVKNSSFFIKITTCRGTQSASSGEKMWSTFFTWKCLKIKMNGNRHLMHWIVQWGPVSVHSAFQDLAVFIKIIDGFSTSVVSIYFGLNYINPSPTLFHVSLKKCRRRHFFTRMFEPRHNILSWLKHSRESTRRYPDQWKVVITWTESDICHCAITTMTDFHFW